MALWTIGKGGEGQSALTNLIDAAITPKLGILDASVLFVGEEISKKLHHIAHQLVWTAQEAAEGANQTDAPEKT